MPFIITTLTRKNFVRGCNKQLKRKKQKFRATGRNSEDDSVYLSRAELFCTFQVASRRWPPVALVPPDTPSTHPTCPSCSERINHCSRLNGRLLFFDYLLRNWNFKNRNFSLEENAFNCSSNFKRELTKLFSFFHSIY